MKYGSESSEDCTKIRTKSAKDLAGAAQGAAWSDRTVGCAVRRDGARAGQGGRTFTRKRPLTRLGVFCRGVRVRVRAGVAARLAAPGAELCLLALLRSVRVGQAAP